MVVGEDLVKHSALFFELVGLHGLAHEWLRELHYGELSLEEAFLARLEPALVIQEWATVSIQGLNELHLNGDFELLLLRKIREESGGSVFALRWLLLLVEYLLRELLVLEGQQVELLQAED